MWQEGYKERYECPICEIPVTEENYDWVAGRCKGCVYMEQLRKERENREPSDSISVLREKAKKYDEIQNLWWWMQRRTHGGRTPMSVIRYFLHGIKEHLKPYKEDGSNDGNN